MRIFMIGVKEKHYIGVIPAILRYDTSISNLAKLLYCEINAKVDDDNVYCVLEKNKIAYQLKMGTCCSIEWVNEIILELKNKGFIALKKESYSLEDNNFEVKLVLPQKN